MLSAAAAGGIQQERHFVPGAFETECAPVHAGPALEEAGKFFLQREQKHHLLTDMLYIRICYCREMLPDL